MAAAVGHIAHARTIVVHSTADDGPGSLRQALIEASSGDTINIVASGTITLLSGELVVAKNVTIHGPGPHGIISGNSTSRVFHIMPGVIVTISSLTITNGRVSLGFDFPADAGGAIYSDHATLTLDNCTISNSSANLGGGIFSNAKDGGNASLTINNSTISGNAAHSISGFDGAYGGGIFSGGGFFNTGPSGNATMSLNNAVVTDNTAETYGGGIFNDGFAGMATLAIVNSTISGNRALNNFNNYASGGGIYNNGDSGLATVTATNCALSGNLAHTWGGAIFNDGTASVSPGAANMTMSNCTVDNNSAGTADIYGSASGGQGGGIYSLGNAIMTLTDSELTGNSVGDEGSFFGGDGGGIYFQGDETAAELRLTSCRVKNNVTNGGYGGGVGIHSALAVFTDTTISNNSAPNFGDGGGLAIDQGLGTNGLSRVTMAGCTVSDNSAGFFGGGIINAGAELNLIDCTISGNTAAAAGGGIISENADFNVTVRLENSTVSGNSAGSAGGGIVNGGFSNLFSDSATVIVLNSTLSGNSAPFGGAILNEAGGIDLDHVGKGTVLLNASTLSGNTADFGGGIVTSGSDNGTGPATVEMANTIFDAGASGKNFVQLGQGGFISHGYNLSSDAAAGDTTAGPGGFLNSLGDMRNTKPLLGPLTSNGGPTLTHALLTNSPAINAGDPNFDLHAFTPPLLYDQRDGPRFPRIVNGRVDIGAFEFKNGH
jgi:hypothetical protein